MNFFRKVENFFEKNIEGFFNKKFAGGLQPVELAKEMSRQMEDGRTVSVSKIYVPNHYTVYLRADDYEKLVPYGAAIRDELAGYLAEEARKKGYTLVGRPIVDLFTAKDPFKGQFLVKSRFSEPLPEEEEDSDTNSILNPGANPGTDRVASNTGSLSDTRVFSRMEFSPSGRVAVTGMLTVVEGLDAGVKLDLGAVRVNMGRREGNELPLADLNTSRLHAFITFEEGKHVLHDAKSLNGTYVNGHRITRKALNSGDRIRIGNTIILYEVK